jgi:hypothetical protein
VATTKAAKATAEPLTISFTFEKETKGTIRYAEDAPADGSRPAIGTLYITKRALEALNTPKALLVTVESAD